MAKAQTDKEKKDAMTEAEGTTAEAEQEDFGLPEGVSTSQTRGENDVEDAGEPEEIPNPTPEEQMAGGSDAQKEAAGIEPEAEA